MWRRYTKLFILSAAVLLVAAACAKTPAINGASAAVSEVTTTEAAATVDNGAAITPSSDADRVVEVELSEFAIAAANFEFVT
jgi:ABC-type Fe3+-hydroxamate transport system substrate-binding protein